MGVYEGKGGPGLILRPSHCLVVSGARRPRGLKPQGAWGPGHTPARCSKNNKQPLLWGVPPCSCLTQLPFGHQLNLVEKKGKCRIGIHCDAALFLRPCWERPQGQKPSPMRTPVSVIQAGDDGRAERTALRRGHSFGRVRGLVLCNSPLISRCNPDAPQKKACL